MAELLNMTQTALARALGVSKARVSQLKARGMPVDNVEDARAWIAANTTEGTGHKHGAKSPAVTAAAKAMARQSDETQATNTDDPAGVLSRMREAERRAFALIDEALKKAEASREDADYAVLPGLLRAFNSAAANALDAQARWERHCRNSGQVAPVEHLLSVLQARLEPLAAQLRNLPRSVAAAANPKEPEIAEAAIAAAIETILRQVTGAMKPIAATP